LRLGLAGAGADLSPYCDEYGGAILNATLDRFASAHVVPRTTEAIFRARDIGEEETVDPDADLPVRRGCCCTVPSSMPCHGRLLWRGRILLTLSTTIDVPADSGLGASAVVVALIEAFRSALKLPLGPYQVGRPGILDHVEPVLVAHVDNRRSDFDRAGLGAHRRQGKAKRAGGQSGECGK
jgi:D-glycero-alpha-D-manno-heptose-7-phosphate kinase